MVFTLFVILCYRINSRDVQ